MADNVEVKLGGKSAEEIAHWLFVNIQNVEKVSLSSEPSPGWKQGDRAWILKAYSECINAVKHGSYG